MMDYAAIAAPRLTGQFGESPNLQGFVRAIVEPLSEVEVTFDALKSERWISTAIGAQLDGAGSIVGEERLGRSDSAYRDAIRFRVFINIAKGAPVNLIRGVRYLTAPTDAQYIEAYPATVLVFTNGLFVDSSIQTALQEITPAGVSTVPVMVSPGLPVFRFDSADSLTDFFINQGFGQEYLTVNGAILKVTGIVSVATGTSTFGGVVPAELDVGGFALDVEGSELVVYDPNSTIVFGREKLAGVFQ